MDRTIELWRTLRSEGLANVGLVFQSYLYRTEQDIRAGHGRGLPHPHVQRRLQGAGRPSPIRRRRTWTSRTTGWRA